MSDFLDQRFAEPVPSAPTDLFGLTDVFLYSHGWGQTGSNLPSERNAFCLGVAKALQGLVCASPTQWAKMGAAFAPLDLPVPWLPGVPEETLRQRADSIGCHAGYSLLRLLIERLQGRQPYRFNLIGHGLGCRVLCGALQALAEDEGMRKRLSSGEFNIALLQPGVDSDSLAPGARYGQVQRGIPRLRMLVTTSAHDVTLSPGFPLSMAATGPTGDLYVPVDQRFDVTTAIVPTFTEKLGVANLTPLQVSGASDGLHLPQIYDLLARFFGQ